jgi:formate dehydrogenase major subunit
MSEHGLSPLSRWPVYRQARKLNLLGLDGTAASPRTESLAARSAKADKVVGSVCPYCAVGFGQLVYVQDEKIIDIEGDPASPLSHGCLCPKGAATLQLVTGSHRVDHVLHSRPHATRREQILLEDSVQSMFKHFSPPPKS